MSTHPTSGLAIWASGRGSNAEKIIDACSDSLDVTVDLIVTNNPEAGVIELARDADIPWLVIDHKSLRDHPEGLIDIHRSMHIEWIALAGFLRRVPAAMIEAFPRRIINIHPALLPRYGGKGMYGMHVHEAVAEARDSESGMTLHYVNEAYDEGDIIFQARCPLEDGDTAAMIARKVLALEHEHYAPELLRLIRADRV